MKYNIVLVDITIAVRERLDTFGGDFYTKEKAHFLGQSGQPVFNKS